MRSLNASIAQVVGSAWARLRIQRGSMSIGHQQPPTAAIVTIKTDLYTAEIDPVGGAIVGMALAQHRDAFDKTKPYLALQRSGERTFVAQAGLLGEGMPNHRTTWDVLPGPRELAPGQDRLEVKLQATAANGANAPARSG